VRAGAIEQLAAVARVLGLELKTADSAARLTRGAPAAVNIVATAKKDNERKIFFIGAPTPYFGYKLIDPLAGFVRAQLSYPARTSVVNRPPRG